MIVLVLSERSERSSRARPQPLGEGWSSNREKEGIEDENENEDDGTRVVSTQRIVERPFKANMKIVLNGEPYEHKGDGRLESLLKEIGASAGRVAVMVNGEVVKNADMPSVRLGDDDRVEIITMMPGG